MPKIIHLDQLDLNQNYSYADYLTWQIKEAMELIKGKIMLMSPAPNVAHQSISGNLHALIHPFFKHKKCRVFAAPFDVRLYDRKNRKKNSIYKAATAHPIGLLKFFPKEIPNGKFIPNMSFTKKVACWNIG